ncbi:MAG: diversity-generating retroelement protein Avd [bacterium]|nr:diversity-generating retroelement protein Avd [bacterium]
MIDDLIIHQKTYDFLLWLYPLINKFPKSQRFVLGQQIENKTLDVLTAISRANNEREKSGALKQLSLELDGLRLLIRLAKDLHFLTVKHYETAADKINEIGRLLHGWQNKFSNAI